MGVDSLCSSAERQQLALDVNQTAATTLLHRRSETTKNGSAFLTTFFVLIEIVGQSVS